MEERVASAAPESEYSIGERQLKENLRQQQGKSSKGCLLGGVSGVALLLEIIWGATCYSDLTGWYIVLVGVTVVALIVGVAKVNEANNAIKAEVSETLVYSELTKAFENVSYYISEYLPQEAIETVAWMFPRRVDKIKGNDCVRARYKGLQFEIADISLAETSESTDEDGDTSTSDDWFFKGLWMCCELGCEFPENLVLEQISAAWDQTRHRKNLLQYAPLVAVEDEAFMQRFLICAQDAKKAGALLTPEMRRLFLNLSDWAGQPFYLQCTKAGVVYLLANTQRDLFEVHHSDAADNLEPMKEGFAKEIRFVTNLLDEMLQIQALWKE